MVTTVCGTKPNLNVRWKSVGLEREYGPLLVQSSLPEGRFSQSLKSLKSRSEVSIRNNGPSQKAAKMWHTHTLSHILHVVCAVIYFFFHSHTFTMCNSQHDLKKKEKRKSKSQNKIMGTFMFTAAASGVDGTDKAQAKGRGAP